MELDWYADKMRSDAVLTPTSSFRRMMSPSMGDSERSGSSRWTSLFNLMQDRGILKGYYSGDEYSPPGSNLSSPKKMRGSPQCARSLSGGTVKCSGDSTISSSSLSPSSSAKSHLCFGCVLHSHVQ